MPNLGSLVVRASDIKLAITIIGPPAFSNVFQTWDNFSWNDDSKTALIYAGGTDDPIAIKQSEYKYSGRLSIQDGELEAFMALEGVAAAMKLGQCILSVVKLNGTFNHVYTGVMFKNSAGDSRRGELETIVNLEWLALNKK